MCAGGGRVCAVGLRAQVSGVLVGVPVYSNLDRQPPAPRLQLAVNSLLGKEDLAAVVAAVKKAVQQVLR